MLNKALTIYKYDYIFLPFGKNQYDNLHKPINLALVQATLSFEIS